jgi:ankyrin repeat protein
MVELLINKGADVNSRSTGHKETRRGDGYVSDNVNKDHTPLLLASKYGRKYVAEVLISNGADVNAIDNDGNTPLMLVAGYHYHRGIVKLLIDAKVDVNAQNRKGETALMKGAMHGHADVLKLLINANADVDTKANNGITALTMAAAGGHVDAVNVLKAAAKSSEIPSRQIQLPISEDSSSVSVFIKDPGPNIIRVVVIVRSATHLGIYDSHTIVLSSGKQAVRESISLEAAEKLRKELEDAGAIVEIRTHPTK